jgi:hypothetical protein
MSLGNSTMTFYEYSGMVAGALITAAVIFRTVILPVHRWATRLEKTISFVEQQMLPNGGSSLRDSVNRIEYRLNAVEEHITLPK